MTNPTSNFGWQMPTATDLVTDLPADFEVFGQAVDTDFVDLLGGTTGQVLSKTSATDLDFTWINNDTGDITGVTAGTGISGGGTSGTVTVTNDMATTITTNGDLIYGTGSGTYTRRAIGTTGQILTVASGIPTWSTPSASMTSIASGSIPTGTNILTLSSISSSYTHLQLVLLAWNGSGNNTLVAKVNNDSTAVYATNVVQIVAGASAAFGDVDYTSIRLTGNGAANAGNNKNVTIMNFPFYTNATTGKIILSTTGFQDSGTTRSFVSTNNYYSGTNAAISRIDITYGSNYSGGTYVLYGVN